MKLLQYALLLGALGLFFFWTALRGETETSAGKDLFLKFKCNRCHTITALNIAQDKSKDEEDQDEGNGDKEEVKKPKDLSNIGTKHNADWIAGWLTKKEKIKDMKTKKMKTHKKKFKGTEAELKSLSEWVASLKHETK